MASLRVLSPSHFTASVQVWSRRFCGACGTSVYTLEYIGMKLWRESWALAAGLEVTGILIKALDRSYKESSWNKKKRGCL